MIHTSKHADRDAKLPDIRQKLLNNALHDMQKDPNVLGIYLTGSLSKGNHDLYSDIDLHTVVKPGMKKTFIAHKYERPKGWGRVLYFEGTSNSPVIVAHFDCFVKMDTWYHEPSELKPSVWFHGTKVLYDPGSIIEKVIEQSSQIVYTPDSQDVVQWRGKIFAYIHEAYRSVMRNELYYALSNLDKFRWMIAYGWYMEQGRKVDGSFGVWSKMEAGLAPWQLDLLHTWDCSRNGDAIMKTIEAMVPEFLRLNQALSNAVNIDDEDDLCHKVLSMVL